MLDNKLILSKKSAAKITLISDINTLLLKKIFRPCLAFKNLKI